MEVIPKTIEYSRPDWFTIYPIGDIHLGVVHCDEDKLNKTVDEIKNNKNALWIGMGDYADCITPSDFKRWDGRILADWMKGKEDNIGATQCRKVDEIFSPIWNKCLGLIEGNHEESIRKFNHYNIMEEILLLANKKYTIPYGGVSCLVNLKFKRKNSNEVHDIIGHARHGEGSARTSGARALAVLRLASVFINAHWVASGHLHGQESPDIPERLILRNGQIKSFETIATMTGAWLKGFMQGVPPIYFERWGCAPSTLGCPVIRIQPDTSKMELIKSRVTRAL